MLLLVFFLLGGLLVLLFLPAIIRRQQSRRDAGPERASSSAPVDRLVDRLPGLLYLARSDRRLLFASDGAQRLLGLPAPRLVADGRSLLEMVHPDDRRRVEGTFAAIEEEDATWALGYRMLPPQGGERWVWDSGRARRSPTGELLQEGYLAPLSSPKDPPEEAGELPYDPLTHLPNRAVLLERAERARRRSRRKKRPYAMLCVALDPPGWGDDESLADPRRLLPVVARRLEAAVREEDAVARIGTTDFALLLAEVDEAEQAMRIAGRVRDLLALPLHSSQQQTGLTASIGIALAGTEQPPAEALDLAAETARRVQEKGGDGRRITDRALHESTMCALRLEEALRAAIEAEQFRLVYQPIIDLDDGTRLGFEALLRWDHPQRGTLSPADFLERAVDSGLIVDITWWVLAEASRQLAVWRNGSGLDEALFVSVNFTPAQLEQPDLVQHVQAVLAKAGLPAERLEIEVTEQAALAEPERVARALQTLRDLGVRLSLDDFGSGTSSLDVFRRLPLTGVKIDRTFIAGFGSSDEILPVMAAIVDLAHGLQLTVTAEGVETPEQAAALRKLGCDQGQGFLWSAPRSPAEIDAQLSGNGDGGC